MVIINITLFLLYVMYIGISEGPLDVDTSISESEMIHYNHKDLQPGGIWEPGEIGEPSTCVSCYHVAIIIPYRDRYNHLRILLHELIPVLQRQHIKFRIFVVEQVSIHLANRGFIILLKVLGTKIIVIPWVVHLYVEIIHEL